MQNPLLNHGSSSTPQDNSSEKSEHNPNRSSWGKKAELVAVSPHDLEQISKKFKTADSAGKVINVTSFEARPAQKGALSPAAEFETRKRKIPIFQRSA